MRDRMRITNKWVRFFIAIGSGEYDCLSKVARDHDTTYSYVSQIVKGLEMEGFIKVEKDDHNRRIKGRMTVTKKGEAVYRAVVILDDHGMVKRVGRGGRA